MFKRLSTVTTAVLLTLGICGHGVADSALAKKKVAAIVTLYSHNSHADVIVGRLLQGYQLNGEGEFPGLELVSLYADQVPETDLSRKLQEKFGFRIFDNVADALTLGTDKLAVDGILLVAEHGSYPDSDTGQTLYPKRRLFEQIVGVFDRSGRVVPIFSDKHLSDNWRDASWIYETARKKKIPFMAGSSLPTTWRDPPRDVTEGTNLEELVAIAYGPQEAYGFHALEMLQCLAERRAGGETGVRRAVYYEGPQIWSSTKEPLFDRALLDRAVARLPVDPVPDGGRLEDVVPNPSLFQFEYQDGLRVSVLFLDGAAADFTAAWRTAEGDWSATRFALQEDRPFMHFTFLLQGIERMMTTGKPTWPVERTLLTTGMLNAVMISKRDGGKPVETPYLDIRYLPTHRWSQPASSPGVR